MRFRRTVALALAAAFFVALIIIALGGLWGGPPSYSEGIDVSLVERTCEIVRDITGDAAAGGCQRERITGSAQTLTRRVWRERSGHIQTPLRNAVAAKTDVSLGAGLGRLDSACSARGS